MRGNLLRICILLCAIFCSSQAEVAAFSNVSTPLGDRYVKKQPAVLDWKKAVGLTAAGSTLIATLCCLITCACYPKAVENDSEPVEQLDEQEDSPEIALPAYLEEVYHREHVATLIDSKARRSMARYFVAYKRMVPDVIWKRNPSMNKAEAFKTVNAECLLRQLLALAKPEEASYLYRCLSHSCFHGRAGYLGVYSPEKEGWDQDALNAEEQGNTIYSVLKPEFWQKIGDYPEEEAYIGILRLFALPPKPYAADVLLTVENFRVAMRKEKPLIVTGQVLPPELAEHILSFYAFGADDSYVQTRLAAHFARRQAALENN
jgi:hypothetical protein